MSVSKEVFVGCCYGYLGFYEEIFIHNNHEVVIYISRNGYDEKLYSFRKKYVNYEDLLNSLGPHIAVLKEQEKNISISVDESEILSGEIYKIAENKLSSDFLNRCIFLPDNGKDFIYGK